MTSFGKGLVEAARQAQIIARGEADPATYRVHVPSDIDVKAIRKKIGLSQARFAQKFGLSAASIRDWEQRRRTPDPAARVLLMIIDKEPEAVARALASEAA